MKILKIWIFLGIFSGETFGNKIFMKFENLMQAEFSIKLICQHEIRARKLAFLEEDKLHYFAVNHSLKQKYMGTGKSLYKAV